MLGHLRGPNVLQVCLHRKQHPRRHQCYHQVCHHRLPSHHRCRHHPRHHRQWLLQRQYKGTKTIQKVQTFATMPATLVIVAATVPHPGMCARCPSCHSGPVLMRVGTPNGTIGRIVDTLLPRAVMTGCAQHARALMMERATTSTRRIEGRAGGSATLGRWMM